MERPNRFDYVKYDETSEGKQIGFKELFKGLEQMVELHLPKGRPQSLVFTHLEEAYMWVGKAIRDEQVGRNFATALQESRIDS